MGLLAHLTLLLAGRGISRPFLWAKNEPGPCEEARYWPQSGISDRPGASRPEVAKTGKTKYLTGKIRTALRRSMQAMGPGCRSSSYGARQPEAPQSRRNHIRIFTNTLTVSRYFGCRAIPSTINVQYSLRRGRTR